MGSQPTEHALIMLGLLVIVESKLVSWEEGEQAVRAPNVCCEWGTKIGDDWQSMSRPQRRSVHAGGARMPQMMGTPQGPPLQTFNPGASPSMIMSPGASMPTRRGSLTPPRPLGPSAASLSPGQLGGLGPAGVVPGMQLRDPLGGGRGGAAEQLQQSMAGLSLMGGQGGAQPPPPPPPQAQMMMEGGGVMVPQVRRRTVALITPSMSVTNPRQ